MQTIAKGSAESRMPAILAVCIVAGLVRLLPERYHYGPPWFPYLVIGLILGAMVAVTVAPQSVFWHRIERFVVIGLVFVTNALNVLAVGRLLIDMITHNHGYSAITLLESATVIWTLNVVLFALLYWQADRGGPEGRAAGYTGPADFHFSEEDDPHPGASWEPRFIEYLFLAFTASTSFTAPEHMRPVTRRAKIAVMFQAVVSMVTLFLIASRAISTLS
jgi:hypothetical protein